MKKKTVIILGIIIWMLGVSLYTLSYYLLILDDPELQATIFLALGILPIVWFGSKLYYQQNSTTEGYWIGLVFFLIATVLDALITVPFLMVPNGGTYYSFFTAIGFWVIGIEIVATATCYWYLKVFSKNRAVRFL